MTDQVPNDDLENPPSTLRAPTTAPKYSISRTASPAPSESDTRPLILCLHGGGSTATVFKIQCRRLIWTLSSQFRFIFCNAPHPGAPGFGMLPVFASCAPFHRWVTRRWKLGDGDAEETSVEEVEAVDGVLDSCVAKETGNDVEEVRQGNGWERVVGVMGFSQGARLVPGLLLRQKIAERDGHASKHHFRFGVIIGGPYCPISLSQTVDVRDYELLREMPTVHGWGRDDHVKSGCEEMQRMCEGDTCFQMDFAGGHHMPLTDVEAKDLCDLILASWYAGGGRLEVGKGEKY